MNTVIDIPLIASVILRTSLVLLAGLLAIRILRSHSPKLRHELAVMSIAVALLIPLAHLALPSLNVLPGMTIPGAQQVETFLTADPHDAISDASLANSPLAEQALSTESASSEETPVSSNTNPVIEAATFVMNWLRSLTISELLLLVWAMGVVLMLGRMVSARRTLNRVWHSAVPVSTQHWQDAMDEAGDRVFLKRVLQTRELAGIRSPMTWGIFRPRLVVPLEAREWHDERKLNALMHEMVHVRRYDAVHDVISAVLVAFNWFNPLAWLMRSELKAQREASCDAEVLQMGAQPEEYARMLIDVAKDMRQHRSAPRLAMTIARPSQLEGRVLSVLNYKGEKYGMHNRWVVAGTMTFILLFASAAAPVGGARPEPSGEQPAATSNQGALPSQDSRPADGYAAGVAEEKISSPDDAPNELPSAFPAADSDFADPFEPVTTENERAVVESAITPDEGAANRLIMESGDISDLESDLEQAIGDLFAVTGIQLADAVLKELGRSVEQIDWKKIAEEMELDLEDDKWTSNGEWRSEGDPSRSEDSSRQAMSRLGLSLQHAVVDELERVVREEPGTDAARRSRKALLKIDSEASRAALKRLGLLQLGN